MNKHTFLSVVFALMLAPSALAFAQEEELPPYIIEENIKKPFSVVYKAVKRAFDTLGCRVEVEKSSQDEKTNLYKGNIRSEFRIFAMGEDSTLDVLSRFGVTPTIRGGRWVTGRIQYSFVIKEREDESTDLKLQSELSGYEDFVTSRVHFWNSNGILDKDIFALVKRITEESAK